ncbi:equilibrative nucleoside transporter 1 [Eurosta solidaginis]|uniref:equilibrative nucleoside transporter 1 n=1 Tax=Eurosta solidaginis TaxID=178769 RepID=UPI003530F883
MPTRWKGKATDQQVLIESEEFPQSGNAIDNGVGDPVHKDRLNANTDSSDEDDIKYMQAILPTMNNEMDEADLRTNRQILISNAPPDRYSYTYAVFYLLGVATMTPWNFFVTAEDYWMYKFRNTTINDTSIDTPELTPMQKSFTCDLTLTASISGTTFLILNAIYGHLVSLNVKILGTLFTILGIFIVTTSFVEVNTDQWQEQFFLITLLTVVIINISSATMSGGIFGVAGLFPSLYMTALVSGQALGGIISSLAFIFVLAFGAAPSVTAFIYFIIATVTILLSIICYAIMSHQPFFIYYFEGGDKYEILADTPSHSRSADVAIQLEPNIKEVFGKIFVESVNICLLFATTLSVYPGVTVLMQSENYGKGYAWNDIYYMPVVNYLFFNSGDYFGRILAGLWERPRDNPHTVLLMTVIRMIYVPLFLCSNSNIHYFLPILVHTDTSFIIMILTFGITNGYLANINLIMAPRSVMRHEKEMASSIMAASLSLGLAVGSLLSMSFVQML